MKFTTRLTRLTKTKLIVISVILGLATGLGSYTFIYAKGYSYLTNDPNACANCHIMQEQFDGWVKSSHRNAATCNDCHTPSGFVAKYANKASNGFWHSFGFTTGWFHEPIQIKPHNREITENACRKCHTSIVEAIEPHGLPQNQLDCLQCHRNVGHLH
ncbi:MAG: cytochrome c nitrite reductase small subunit [Acidobacteria bacterium]|nr:cytochrome c nitrite reductase small subunit [Acidobacteriota bacterium]